MTSYLCLECNLGQRKYGGPPPNWDGPTPGNGCEVFCGKIPKDMYEDELIPLFEKCGPIWDLRLMMDPMTGTNRGYAFVTFTTRDSAQNAVKEVSIALTNALLQFLLLLYICIIFTLYISTFIYGSPWNSLDIIVVS